MIYPTGSVDWQNCHTVLELEAASATIGENMDRVVLIRVVAGILAFVVLVILILRTRKKARL